MTPSDLDNTSQVPPPVNMDPDTPLPGSISVNERFAQDLAASRGPKEEPRIQVKPLAPVRPPIADIDPPPLPKFADPEATPAVVDENVLSGQVIQSGNPVADKIEEAIATQKSTDAGFTILSDISEANQPVAKLAEIIPEDTKPEENAAILTPEEIKSLADIVQSGSEQETLAETEHATPGLSEPPTTDDEHVSEFTDPVSQTALVTSAVAPSEEAADVPDVAEGPFIQGIVASQVEKATNPNLDDTQFIPGPKKLDSVELITIQDFSTTHYRIIEGVNPQAAKLKREVDLSSVKVKPFKDTPDFEMQVTRIDQAAADGERRVQIVATQSGYAAMVRPMHSRELRTFGRELRDSDTYSYKMHLYSEVYRKLCEFTCGPMTFEQFINVTAFPDLQTLIFGLYHASFPTVNNFNLTCFNPKCGETFSVPIANNTLVCIPAGSVAQQQISDTLNGKLDPKELIASSNRNKGIDIFISKKTKYFRVKTPSIAEFLENAYRGKKEDVIEDNASDMYYAGYIRGVGKLDIDAFNKTGVAEYYYDTRIETIDREIAMLDPDEKEKFERAILDYINKYSVSYQIPRVRCPHCGKIMNQREINMENLFFVVKSQKGLA